MENSILTTVVLPISLAIIMLGMGLSLTINDFKRVFKHPKAALLGLTNQMIVLPIIGFSMALLFDLDPVLAVGLMLIAACPGGATSNLITHVAKGDIALSISLTAITSIATVFTIPIILSFALNYFMNETGTNIELPIGETMLQITGITIVPVTIGMLIKHYKQDFALKMEKSMRIASTVIFVAVLLGIIMANKEIIVDSFKQIGLVALGLNLATMAVGYFSARGFKLDLKQSISITIESGIQNGTLAIVVALSILGRLELTVPAVVYSLTMFFTAGFLMWYFGRRKD
ncbi:bile acid:sodium symporter family protein [Urechidicola vernalis]|uniref:Bile acid:sodium symporter family protein n=1 Tax=Urechidicola vernalis TaxID=3075600 RepID=A0ABU2Y3W5_9FLAO|nr:bile acid:sodium symporter family protein [Urechidicola sp. P050]MDT0551728.1 bile acid:sodium symporter family protein [Urechidicola sp. P050]